MIPSLSTGGFGRSVAAGTEREPLAILGHMTATPRRATVRSVAMPAEHGGWGLTLEPGILGFLLAPSLAGILLAIAALLAMMLRTPLRIVLLRHLRGGQRTSTAFGLERARLATRVAAVELAILCMALAGTAVMAADPGWALPLIVALPLLAVAFLFDLRSLSRHLIPEIVGSVAVAGVAAMGALAGGATAQLAAGAWLILAARVLSSIPHVRAQVLRIHGRAAPSAPTLLADIAALATAAVAVLLEPALLLGAIAVTGLVAIQRVTLARPPRPAKVLGVRQMVLGFAVVGATAIGTRLL
jgi:hypothetical protein